MIDSKELDKVQDTVTTMGLPEVFYGDSHFFIANKSKNILLEFCPVEAVSFSSYAKRQDWTRASDEPVSC